MKLVTLAVAIGLAVTVAASARATPPVPWATSAPSADPARRPPVPEAQSTPDRHALATAEVTRALSRIERTANVLQQHPEQTNQAQAASREAHAIAPKLKEVAPPDVDPGRLVRSVDAMAESARRRDTPSQTRRHALDVIAEVHRYDVQRPATPPSEW